MTEDHNKTRLRPDKNVTRLLDSIATSPGHHLIIADENWVNVPWNRVASDKNSQVDIVSNRYDIAKQAQHAGLPARFNDLNFDDFEDHSFDSVLFRVSKERASSHHVINQATRLLKHKGRLMLSGGKNDGIKSYTKSACQCLGDHTSANKDGTSYLAEVCLLANNQNPLDDNNYAQLRPIEDPSLQMMTKPGIFGWNKIDRGSAFLADCMAEFSSHFVTSPNSLLDLGCGYGYLANRAENLSLEHITLTDNNAAALAAVAVNFKQSAAQISIVASDAGDIIQRQFDTIWCNPPFHQGFSVDADMSSKFLRNSKRLLMPEGYALFVVNAFIPLAQKAQQYFTSVDEIGNNGSFKVIALRH